MSDICRHTPAEAVAFALTVAHDKKVRFGPRSGTTQLVLTSIKKCGLEIITADEAAEFRKWKEDRVTDDRNSALVTQINT